jgi:urease accessory protein
MPRDELPQATRWRARLELAFERRGERTVLAARRHDGPLVVQKPLYPEGPSVCHAIVVHPPGGIAAGDDLSIGVVAGDGASALMTTPGAGKWYRSGGAWATQRVSIAARGASGIEWLPQETIVYEGAHADIGWEAVLEGDARLVAWDIVCFGRVASGERFERGRLRTCSRIRRDGRLAWTERGCLGPESKLASSPAGLAGKSVLGTMVVAAREIGDAWLAEARSPAPREGEAAATRLPGVLVVRFLGESAEAAREHFTAVWRRLREAVLGRPAVEPRIWRT